MKSFFTESFKSQLKRLKRKFPSIKEDFLECIGKFDCDKEINLGRSIYKIRIASSDLSRGKSGGFRAYVYLYKRGKLLVPICIYFKGQKSGITDNELKYHFDKMIKELGCLE